MDELMTVSQVSREYQVSTRMLRYYEKLGMLSSVRRDGYAYRLYEARDIARLRQILILRKLRIPLKEIKMILEDPSATAAVSVFQKNIAQLDAETQALTTLRGILEEFLNVLKSRAWLPAGNILLEDKALLELVNDLSLSKNLLREESTKRMEELNRAEEMTNQLKDVRIVHLPAATVAAAHYVGEDPEDRVGAAISDFVRENRLWEKPGSLRLYGFNHPNPVDETGYHGYEMWVTIPEDVEVPEPLMKKKFEGGVYAAHMIRMGDFQEWALLDQWVRESNEYDYCGNGDPEVMYGSLEEHLNYHSHIQETPVGEPETTQLDLLIPVKKRKK